MISPISHVKNPIKKILLYLILALLLFFILALITKPIRIKWSDNYQKNGDKKLAAKQYLPAEVEYDKSLTLFWGNKKARERLILARGAETNVLSLLPFYEEIGAKDKLALLKSSISTPQNSLEAVKTSRDLILKEEYQLAINQATVATKMDPNYVEAWLYLGISNYKAASLLQLSTDSKNSYLSSAKIALQKTLQLDATNADAKTYLELSGKN